MKSDQTQPEYIRRKFTLPQTMDDLLSSLADRHYQGNVSLYLRSAISDHRDTLEGSGSGERTLQELIRAVNDTGVSLNELDKQIIEVKEQVSSDETTISSGVRSAHSALPREAQQVLQVCINSDQGCRFEDIRDQTALPAQQVQESLHRLLDLGYIIELQNNRFDTPDNSPSQGGQIG